MMEVMLRRHLIYAAAAVAQLAGRAHQQHKPLLWQSMHAARPQHAIARSDARCAYTVHIVNTRVLTAQQLGKFGQWCCCHDLRTLWVGAYPCLPCCKRCLCTAHPDSGRGLISKRVRYCEGGLHLWSRVAWDCPICSLTDPRRSQDLIPSLGRMLSPPRCSRQSCLCAARLTLAASKMQNCL